MAEVPINPLLAFTRAFQQAQGTARQAQQQEEANALTEQLRQIQLLNAQRQMQDALKTPEQKAQEALTAQLITQAVQGGGVRAAEPGLQGLDVAITQALAPQAQTALESGQITPQAAIAALPPVEFETPVPGTGGAFVESPVLARENQARKIAEATALAGARRTQAPPGFRIVTDELGNQSLVQVTGAGAGSGAVTPLTGPGGAPVKSPPKASTGALTQGQQNSLLEKAAKNGVNVEEFRDSTTGQIDFQNLSIRTGQAEGEGVRAENAIRNARLAASASKSGKPTVSQENFQIYGNRMEQADKVLEGLSDKGFDPTSIGVEGLVGQWSPNLLKTSDRQSYEQAQRNFINAVLRKESGAVISDAEFDNARIQYFPQPGDSADLLAQKAATRRLVIDEFKKLGAGAPADTAAPTGAASSAPATGSTKIGRFTITPR